MQKTQGDSRSQPTLEMRQRGDMVRKQMNDMIAMVAEKKKKAEAVLQQSRRNQQLHLDLASKAVVAMLDQGKASSEEAERMHHIDS